MLRIAYKSGTERRMSRCAPIPTLYIREESLTHGILHHCQQTESSVANHYLQFVHPVELIHPIAGSSAFNCPVERIATTGRMKKWTVLTIMEVEVPRVHLGLVDKVAMVEVNTERMDVIMGREEEGEQQEEQEGGKEEKEKEGEIVMAMMMKVRMRFRQKTKTSRMRN